ncbi:Rhodanese-related sulfurtransferase [Flavobacterium longum]|uniref:rhodanese-like domain-containing protein n=1 Tax=Flavobacterium longum TaxID=1299340 RepID=UPI0039E92DE6
MFGILKSLFGSASSGLQISENAFLVDVRTPSEYASGHVKGSVNIPLDQIQNQLVKFKGKPEIVVFCRSGMRSSQAKSILERNGFNNVINGGTWNRVDQIVQQKKR